jgi:hypothetical protein
MSRFKRFKLLLRKNMHCSSTDILPLQYLQQHTKAVEKCNLKTVFKEYILHKRKILEVENWLEDIHDHNETGKQMKQKSR